MTIPTRKIQGFTLVELMVAVGILAVVSSQILSVFSGQLQTQISQRRVLEVQEDSSLVADMIRRDIRMAGFMVPAAAGISTVDGGTANPDILCTSDLSALNPGNVDAASERYDGAATTAAVNPGGFSVSVTAADLDMDGDGTNDYSVDSGIVLTQGTATHCARIIAIAGGTITFTPPAPTGVTLPIGSVTVPAVVYELSGSNLSRNNLDLSSQMEDLQLEFGVDANGDGQIEDTEIEDDLNGSDLTLIRIVRLYVLTRTREEDTEMVGPGRTALANRAASGVQDSFGRRLISVTAAPRNLF